MKKITFVSLIVIPALCFLSSCDEEIVYGNKSILERPVTYDGLYWLGSEVDIKNVNIFELTEYEDSMLRSEYSRIYTEKHFIDESNFIPTVFNDMSMLTITDGNPYVFYKVTKGHKEFDGSLANDKYYVTSIRIDNIDYSHIFGVDMHSSAKEKEKKMAEYGFEKMKRPNNSDLAENDNTFTKGLIVITFDERSFSVVYVFDIEPYYCWSDENFDSTIFFDDSKPGIYISLLK